MRSTGDERVDVYRVVAARFLSRAGSEAAFFVGIWGKAAYQLHATPGQLAFVMFAMATGSILGSIVAGVLVDRYGPRRVLALAELTFVPAALGMFFAHDIGALTALVGVWAFTGAPVVTAGSSFAPFLTRDSSKLTRINALIEGAGSASMLTGPALGAVISRYASVDWVFALDAATSVVAALIVWGVHLQARERPEHAERHPLVELREGFRNAYTIRPIRFYLLTGGLVWLTFGAFGALEPLFFRDVVHTGVETLGWVNVFFGLGLIGGAALLPRLPRRVVSARWLTAFVVLNGFGALVYVGSADLRRVVAGAVLWGVAIGALEPLMRTLLHRDTPQPILGRVMGTAEVHHRVGELVPLTIAPVFALRFGVQATLIAFGLAGSAIGLLALPAALSIDRSHVPGAAEIEPFTTADEPITPNP